MKKEMARWLHGELPELVSQGVVPPEVAERLRRHYGEPDAPGGTAKRWAIVLFSILGAALIGGGIILLLAHNWEELSRPARAVIAMTPLTLAAAFGAWCLWTQRPGTAWREGVGTFQTIAIGVAISLIAQTYHLGGRFDEFMLTWSLLALPLAYLLGAATPALLYLVGITAWTGSAAYFGAERLWYFPLLGLALPYLWLTSRANRYHPRPVVFAWALALTAGIGTGLATQRFCYQLDAWPMLFGGLFGLLFLVGARWWSAASATWQRPLQTVGALGAVGLALALSFSDPWPSLGWSQYWNQAPPWRAELELALGALFPVAAIGLWVRSWTRRAWIEAMLGAVPALTVVGWVAAVYAAEILAAALFNLYLFTLGIGTLVIGLRGRRLGMVNAGMAVLAAVILCRFFDSDIGFVLKGIAFIVVGAGFLGTNLVLMRQKGAVK